MKYKELQVDLLKAAYNNKQNKNICIGQDTDNYYVTLDTHAIHRLPKKETLIDIDKLLKDLGKGYLSKSTIESIFKDLNKYLVLTNDSKLIDKKTLKIFKGDNFKVYVDEKLLKYNHLDGAVFKGAKQNYPVGIYEARDLICNSVIMPVNVKEEANGE